MDSIKMAFESIADKKIRSLLTMLGIIIGVGAVLILVSVVQGYNADLTAYYEKQGANKVNVTLLNFDRTNTTDQSGEFMDWVNGNLSDYITGVTPSSSTSGTLRFETNLNETAVIYFGNEQWSACNNYTLDEGRDLLALDMDRRSQVCVIGSYLADTLFGLQDPVGQTLSVNGTPLTVVGVFYQKDGGAEESMDDAVVVPYTLNRQMLDTDVVSQFTVKVASSTDMTTVMNQVESWCVENVDTNETLTRAQMCAMAVNAMGLSDQVSTGGRKTLFSDVSPSAWYNGYVNVAYGEGLINGYGNGTFGPDDPVTYGQVATVLLRMLGYTSAEVGSLWPLDYTDFCDGLGLSQGLALAPNDSLTRGEAAVLLYRALLENVNGSDQPCYETIDGVASTAEAILLDTDAAYGGGSGLLMAYLPDGSGITYYTQGRQQSDALEGRLGALLFDGAGRAVGFVPGEGEARDVTIGSATASTLTASNGSSYRISAGAVVLSGSETYDYSTSGYLQLNSRAGSSVRLFADDTGAIRYLYLAGGTTSASQAAVADTASAASSLARALGISGRSYAITKNGAAADSGDLAEYDVAYYDAATATMRASDYKVTGFVTAAEPNVTAATSLTVAGYEFPVLESAWESLAGVRIGDAVTLLLTDDGKVAGACAPSEVRADMVGILSEDGRSVTLCDSGVTLTASRVDYDEDMLGSLVRVSSSTASSLRCSAPSSSARHDLDVAAGTLGTLELAPACRVYEWAGSGFLYDLEGNRGSASSDFSSVHWLDTISSGAISYYRTNSAGQVDLVLLDSVTGGCYDYGRLTRYTDEEGISAGSLNGQMVYNDAATLTDAGGTSEKYLYNLSGNGRYVGIALGQSATGDLRITAVQALDADGAEVEDFFLQDGDWYVGSGRQEFRVSDQVQIHLTGADLWLEGTGGLESILADGYTLTLYYDRPASQGGQIRIITAQ